MSSVPRTPPLAGDKPQRYIHPLPIPLDSGFRRNDEVRVPAGLLVAAGHVDDLLLFYREVDGVDDLQEL